MGTIRPADPDSASDVAPVRPGEQLAWPGLEGWLRRHVDGLEGEMRVAQFTGGHANLTYCVSFGARELVVRRPPRGVIAPGAHDMAREHRVLRALAPHFDRAPAALAFCDDCEVIGAPFLVAERRNGVVVRAQLPPSLRSHADVERRISFALIDAMVELHGLRPVDVGLEKLGRPHGFVRRQLEGWQQRWQLARDEPLPIFDEVLGRLERTQPDSQRHCIVHNDLKLDNCQFDPANPDRVHSIFDWDMATLGDPMVELGTLLSYWRCSTDSVDRAPTVRLDMSRFPHRSELTDRYVGSTGLDGAAVPWYEAFGLWKQAVVLQQLFRRFQRGESSDVRHRELGPHVRPLLECAFEVLTGRI
jgi:aminoglycoside phosphotransferase (APT) family kinase protein